MVCALQITNALRIRGRISASADRLPESIRSSGIVRVLRPALQSRIPGRICRHCVFRRRGTPMKYLRFEPEQAPHRHMPVVRADRIPAERVDRMPAEKVEHKRCFEAHCPQIRP